MIFRNEMVATRRIVITHEIVYDLIVGFPDIFGIFQYFVENNVQICAPPSIETLVIDDIERITRGDYQSYNYYINKWKTCKEFIIFVNIDELIQLYDRIGEFCDDYDYYDYVLLAVRIKADYIWMREECVWIDKKVAKTMNSETLCYYWSEYSKDIEKNKLIENKKQEKHIVLTNSKIIASDSYHRERFFLPIIERPKES